jgi:hypothetical protein
MVPFPAPRMTSSRVTLFHDTRMSGNATAQRIHNSLLLRTIPIRRISVAQPSRMEKSLDETILSYLSEDAETADGSR